MVRLSWLFDADSCRVSRDEAIKAFQEGAAIWQTWPCIAKHMGWRFVPCVGFACLADAVELLLARADLSH